MSSACNPESTTTERKTEPTPTHAQDVVEVRLEMGPPHVKGDLSPAHWAFGGVRGVVRVRVS